MGERSEHTAGDTSAVPGRRRGRLIYRALAVVLVLVLIVAFSGAGLLWYARGKTFTAPGWIKERIETELARAVPDIAIRFSDLTLTVSGDWQPSLHLTDVSLTSASGGEPVILSDVTGSFDPEALLNRQLRPREITVTGARIHVSRDEAGRYGVAVGETPGLGQGTGAVREAGQALEAVSDLLERPGLSSLRRISGAGLTLQYEDRQSRRSWTVDGGQLMLTRSGKDLRLSGDFVLLGGHAYATSIEMNIAGEMHSRAISLGLRVEDAPARDIATQSVGLAWLGVLDAPISGALRAATDESGKLGPLNGTLQIGKGALAPDDTADTVPFDSARSYFQYDPATQTLTFDELSVQSAWVQATAEGRVVLDDVTGAIPAAMTGQLRITELVTNPAGIYPAPLYLEGAEAEMRLRLDPFRLEVGRLDLRDRGGTLTLAGWFNAEPEGWDVSMTARLAQLTADDLLELWPTAALTKTREWVARNVLDGVIRNIQLGLRSYPTTRPDIVLGFDFEDLITTFMPTMPPLEGASGHAELRGDRFVLTADGGRTYSPDGDGLEIAGTTFIYENTRVKRGPAEVRLRARGPLGDVLTLIDTEPLSLLSKSGRTPDMASGTADVSAKLNFDLVKDLPADQIDVSFAARVTDVASDVLIPNQTLTANALDIVGTGQSIEVSGEAMLGAIPVGGTWSAAFGPEASGSKVDGWLTFNNTVAEQLNLGLPPGAVSGAGRVNIQLDLARDTPPAFTLTSDLAGLAVAVDALNWRKGRNQTGKLEVSGALGTPPTIDRISLNAPGLALDGTIALIEGGGMREARFNRVRVGGWLDAPVVLTGRGRGVPPRITISGGSVDLRNANLGQGSGETGPMALALDRLQVSDAIAVNGFRGEFTGGGGLSGKFSGSINGRAPVNGTIVPKNGRSAVRVTSADAGAALAAAGLLKQGRQGQLELTLNPVGPPGTFDGLLTVKSIWLQDAPAMASLLSSLSVVGLLEQMSGQGIFFTDVEADFRLTPKQVVLRSSSAVGASMGITMDGFYDLANKRMDMQGVVSPVYMINGLGQIFSRKGEGLIGFNYRLTGPSAQPRVQVNPLSVFTPGMFREIFRRPPPTTN